MVVLVNNKDYIPRHANKEDTYEFYNFFLAKYQDEINEKNKQEEPKRMEENKKSTETRVKELYNDNNYNKKKKSSLS